MIMGLREMMEQNPGFAIAGFNVFGFEDASAVIRAAEKCRLPVILMVNRDAASFIPLHVIGPMLDEMGRRATVPVDVHLDHAIELSAIRQAVECRFTSVMFDGSQLSIEENIEKSLETMALTAGRAISVEAEIGSVGYSDPAIKARQEYTKPEDARRFYEATRVDCLAVSVGTVHRMTTEKVTIQYDRLKKIQQAVSVPLVIHGATSVRDEDLVMLSRAGVRKVNLGTCLRMAFGNTLRTAINNNPTEFDRLKLFREPIRETEEEAMRKMRLLYKAKEQKVV